MKGWCPRPLDDGGLHFSTTLVVVVGLPGFEPGTSASRTQRATKLRYSPQRVAPQPDNPSRRDDAEPEGYALSASTSSSGVWYSITIWLIRRFSTDCTLNVQSPWAYVSPAEGISPARSSTKPAMVT